jgi:kynurenine formamidase
LIDLNKYSIIDLSLEIRPGLQKVDGGFIRAIVPEGGQRTFNAHQKISLATNSFMWTITAETHLGTHAECPAHVRTTEGTEGVKTSGEVPIEQWLGEAVVIDILTKKQPIRSEDLQMIQSNDIVIFRSPFVNHERPYLTIDGVKHLIKKKVKQIYVEGMQTNIQIPSFEVHDTLLAHNILFIEGLQNLNKITQDRVFYIGLGLKWIGLDSIWVRAIALEEKSSS